MKNRLVIRTLSLSAAALVGLAAVEGYTDHAIIPTPGDVPTLGFGTTTGVKMGDRITPPVALDRMLTDVLKFEGALKECIKAPLNQAEYDIYVKHAYNIGTGAFCKSSIVKSLNAKDYAKACKHITDWRYITLPNGKKFDCSTPGNKNCSGLWTRRLKDYESCLAAQ